MGINRQDPFGRAAQNQNAVPATETIDLTLGEDTTV